MGLLEKIRDSPSSSSGEQVYVWTYPDPLVGSELWRESKMISENIPETKQEAKGVGQIGKFLVSVAPSFP